MRLLQMSLESPLLYKEILDWIGNVQGLQLVIIGDYKAYIC